MDLEVDRTDLHIVRVVDRPARPLAEGEVRLRVQAFALTSNTITYGVVGDRLGYWDAFPVDGDGDGVGDGDGPEARLWGRIPAWGVAEVVESRSDLVPLAMRVFGFVPMSSHLVVTPGKIGNSGFTDVASHRARLAPVYSRYRTLAPTDQPPPSAEEIRRMVHEPLFLTSFLIDDQLSEQTDLDHLVLSSASSKTAIGTAFCARDRGGPHLVGLTSAANRDMVHGLGLYDRVLTYDALEALPDGLAAYVDIAGDPATRAEVHRHYGDRLRTSLVVGQTHWEAAAAGGEAGGAGLVGTEGGSPGPVPTFFFAPSRVAQRNEAWGPAVLEAKTTAAFDRYLAFVDGWMEYDHAVGVDALEASYRSLLDNRAEPHRAATRAL